MAKEYSPNIRVNAIAPVSFIADQNRALLLQPDGQYTARGQQIVDHTPWAGLARQRNWSALLFGLFLMRAGLSQAVLLWLTVDFELIQVYSAHIYPTSRFSVWKVVCGVVFSFFLLGIFNQLWK